MRVGCEMMLECADTDFPTFYSASHTTVKIGGDNPDNLYLNATIDGRHEYRIRGTRGTVHYLSFGTRANRWRVDGTMLETGNLDDHGAQDRGGRQLRGHPEHASARARTGAA